MQELNEDLRKIIITLKIVVISADTICTKESISKDVFDNIVSSFIEELGSGLI